MFRNTKSTTPVESSEPNCVCFAVSLFFVFVIAQELGTTWCMMSPPVGVGWPASALLGNASTYRNTVRLSITSGS